MRAWRAVRRLAGDGADLVCVVLAVPALAVAAAVRRLRPRGGPVVAGATAPGTGDSAGEGVPDGAAGERPPGPSVPSVRRRAGHAADLSPGIYLLVCETPDRGVGTGWVLEAWVPGRRGRVEPLAGRGAAPAADARVAQAVAVRVLAECGVDVGGWHPAGAEDRRVFVARLRRAAAPEVPVPRPRDGRFARR